MRSLTIFKRSLGFGLLALVLGMGLLALVPEQALAEEATSLITTGLKKAGENVYTDKLTLSIFVGNLIKAILGATGIVFLGITVYAGILYMTAAGEDTKIKKAKGMLTSSIIGLLIIVGAFAITRYVVEAIADAATETGTTEETTSAPP